MNSAPSLKSSTVYGEEESEVPAMLWSSVGLSDVKTNETPEREESDLRDVSHLESVASQYFNSEIEVGSKAQRGNAS